MPIYEFRCLKCGHLFELLQLKKNKKAAKMKCPECKSPEIERVLSKVSVLRSGKTDVSQTTKSCSSGTCASFEIPGPSR